MSSSIFSPCRFFCPHRAARLPFSSSSSPFFGLPLSPTRGSIRLSSTACVGVTPASPLALGGGAPHRHWCPPTTDESDPHHASSPHHCRGISIVYPVGVAPTASTRDLLPMHRERGGGRRRNGTAVLLCQNCSYATVSPTLASTHHAARWGVSWCASSVGSLTEAKRNEASGSSSRLPPRSRRTRTVSSTARETDREAASLSKRLTSPSFSSSSSHTSSASSTHRPAALPVSHKKFSFRPQRQPGEENARDATGSHASTSKGNRQKNKNNTDTTDRESRDGGNWNTRTSLSGRFNRVVSEKGFAFAILLYMLGETINLTCVCIWHWGYLGKWVDIRYWLLVGWCFWCLPASTSAEHPKEDDANKSIEKEKKTNKHRHEHTAAKAVSVPLSSPPLEETSEASRLSHLLTTWDSTVTSFTATGHSEGESPAKGACDDPPSYASSSSTFVTWVEWLDKGPVLWEEGELSLSARFIFHYAMMNLLLRPCYRYQYQCCEKLMPVLQTISAVVLSPLFALARARKSFHATH